RTDLYYRLQVVTIHLPPLRERGDDLPQLVQHYLRRFNRELGKDVQTVVPEALDRLRRYPWPGNVRQLQSVLKQAMLQATGPVLLPEFFDAAFPPAGRPAPGGAPAGDLDQFIEEQLRSGCDNLYEAALHRLEHRLLTRVLQYTGGNQVQAARILGITPGSPRNKIRRLRIVLAPPWGGGAEGRRR